LVFDLIASEILNMDRKSISILPAFSMVVAAILIVAAGTAAQSFKPGSYVPDELLVRFALPADNVVSKAAVRSAGGQLGERLGNTEWQRVRLSPGVMVESALKELSRSNAVLSVQPNFYYRLLATPNDAQFSNTGLYGLTKIAAPSAWDLSTGSSAVVVADIDTGLKYTHEDIAGNAWINPGEIAGNGVDDDANGFVDDIYGADFYYNDSNPADEHGHGTHTAGTIGAMGNNLLGVVGVNWSVKIMAIKIYDSDGYGTTSAMLVNAYSYIKQMKDRGINIRVTNNSYGGCDEACSYDQATKDGIDALGNAGILNVFAAGNDNSNNDAVPSYPVSYTSPSILGVASSTNTDARSGFSNYGVQTVDLAAPGSGIYSTTWATNSSYGTMSGTSMATPHVAGAAALLSAYNPALSVPSLKATLMNTVDVLAGWTSFVKTGGRLNIDSALRNQTVCNFMIGSGSMTVPTKGGIFTVNLTPGTNCDYTVKSNSSWIRVTSEPELSGNGSVTFRVRFNPVISRTGTISIGGQDLTIIQKRN